MEQYLALDKGERVPLVLTFHLLTCKECRKEIKALSHAHRLAKEVLQIPRPINSQSITKVMKEIDPAYKPAKSRISLVSWIATGLFLIIAMLTYCTFANNQISKPLLFTLSLVFAASLTAYCALFIGTNMDFFIKKLHTPQSHVAC